MRGTRFGIGVCCITISMLGPALADDADSGGGSSDAPGPGSSKSPVFQNPTKSLSSEMASGSPTDKLASPSQTPYYSAVRWNEDYGFLRDPSRRTDPIDAIKYIPLNESGDTYLSLGGQIRDRYEYFNNPSFGARREDKDGYDLFRFIGQMDLHIGPYLRAYAQVRTADQFGELGGPRSRDEDNLDLEQAFLELDVPLSDQASLAVRGGRQHMVFGRDRLIGISDFSNANRNYDGVRATLNTPHNSLDVFWVKPVLVDPYSFDNDQNQTSFAGIYDTAELPGALAAAKAKLSLYFLALDVNRIVTYPTVTGAGSEDRYTIGSEFTLHPGPWDFDAELDYQCGSYRSLGIDAWSIALEAGYTFNATMQPRVFLDFDLATGDRGRNNGELNTFNQLFPSGHTYFGYIDFIGRQNIIDLHPGVELLLLQNQFHLRDAALRAEYHQFWRETTSDAMYGTDGSVFRAVNGSGAQSIGSEIDLLLNYQVDQHLGGYFGYSHFFSGPFIQQTGASQGVDFVYAALVYTF